MIVGEICIWLAGKRKDKGEIKMRTIDSSSKKMDLECLGNLKNTLVAILFGQNDQIIGA